MTDPTSLGVSSSMMEDSVVRNMLQVEDITNDPDTVMGDSMELHHAMVEAAQRADEEKHRQQQQQQHQQQVQRQQQSQQQQQRQQQVGRNGTIGSNSTANVQGNGNGNQANGSTLNNEPSRITTTPLSSQGAISQSMTATTDSLDMETDNENATSPTDASVATTVVSPPSICLCQQPQRIPRPRNAFILFRQHHHAQVVSANPGKANPEISKIIGEMWRESTPESKAIWQKHADDEKQKHLQRFPEYRYQPRRNGKRNIAALAGSNPGLSLSLESAKCPNCGGTTGAMSAAPTPATPSFPRQFKSAPTPSSNKRPSLSIPPATPSFLKTTHNEKKPDPSSMSKMGSGVDALIRLGGANDSEDDPSPTSPTNHHIQRKRTKLNHSITTTQQQQMTAHQLMRDLQTPGLMPSHPHGLSDQLDPFALNGPDGLLKHHSHQNPHFDTNAASELEQQMLALQAQGYELGTPSPATTHQPTNLLRQSTQPPTGGQMSIFDKINAIRRTCKSLPALPTPGAQARGAVVAIEGDDKNLVNALTAALAESLKSAEKVDVLTLEEAGDALPVFNSSNSVDSDEENEARMAKLFENVAKYRRKALGIRYSVIGSGRNSLEGGLKINTSSAITGNEDAEGETDSQFGLSPLDTSPATFHSMQHLHPNHHLTHNHSPISPASSLSHLQTSHPHSNGMHLPTPTSPSAKIPVLLLNRYILSLSDSISSSLPASSPTSSSTLPNNQHAFSPTPTTPQQTSPINTMGSLSTPPASPADDRHASWNYALSLFRGVTAPDMIIYVESPQSSSSNQTPSAITSHPNGLARTPTNQNAELDVREDERIVILRGWNPPSKLGGNERVVRRLGFEVSEVLRQLQGFVG
ncbi:hypothetical protein BJ508DRAFT_321085 [Ascobolus immersus RN42]|uniref:HMG box domain-containing protein n=1 Tax=Ascobolus immersus RN42 TaxID=1160509 RepID=A0A3N4IP18_ASCIM|nr:hypothetical protein BJ508DRAFT_321085 [Ascobolus immersus RN42]